MNSLTTTNMKEVNILSWNQRKKQLPQRVGAYYIYHNKRNQAFLSPIPPPLLQWPDPPIASYVIVSVPPTSNTPFPVAKACTTKPRADYTLCAIVVTFMFFVGLIKLWQSVPVATTILPTSPLIPIPQL